MNKIIDKDSFEVVSDKEVIAVIDKIESGKSIAPKKSAEDDYYVGMVGDKRTTKGLNLALTMEERSVGNWLLILNGKEIEKNSLVQTSLLSNPSRFVINVNIKALKDKVVRKKTIKNVKKTTFLTTKTTTILENKKKILFSIVVFFTEKWPAIIMKYWVYRKLLHKTK